MQLNLNDIEQKLRDSGALPYLLSGGVGALAGGVMAGRVKRRGEGKLARLGRILATAGLAGGMTAGAHKLINYGVSQAENALPKDDVSPEQQMVTGSTPRAIAGAVTAAGIAGMTHRSDQKVWKHLSAKPDAAPFGAYVDDKNFRAMRSERLNRAANKGGVAGNAYRRVLNEKQRKGEMTGADRAVSHAYLKSLGIDSSSHRYRFLDPLADAAEKVLPEHMASRVRKGLAQGQGHMMNARNSVFPTVSKLTGRSLPSALRRAGIVGTSVLYPEILSAAKDTFFPDVDPNAQ